MCMKTILINYAYMHTYLLLVEASTDAKSCGITLFTAP